MQDGGCSFATGLPAYLRPEHLAALQPQFRQAANLPGATPLYQLEVTVNPAAASYTGQLTLTFWNRSPQPMPSIVLRTYPDFFKALGGQLVLKEASVNGKGVDVQERAPTFAALPLTEPIAPCSQARLSLRFEGKIVTQLREAAYAVGTFYAGQGFFALGTFYPQLALWEKRAGQANWDWTVTPMRASADLTASEVAFFDVRLQAPASYQLFGTGVSAETPPTQRANKAWRFVGGPFREFAVVGGENYAPETSNGTTAQGNVAVKVFTLKNANPAVVARQQDFARKALAATVMALDEFSAAISPYPYTQYTLVEFPMVGFNGMEWPMFSQFSVAMFTSSYNGQEQEFGGLAYSKPGTLVVIHEVLHQWFYNLVGNDQQAEPFIDEGLTEFCTYLLPQLVAQRNGSSPEAARAFAQSWLDKLWLRVRQQDLPAFGDLKMSSAASEVSLEQAGFIYYRKAPLFYDAFRAKFGEAALMTFLKSYFQRFQYKIVHASDLTEALVAAVPGRENEAHAFINRWFNEKQIVNDLIGRP